MIWEDGYRRGDFTGHVYADAARNLRAWHGAGIRLYVYSSGSVRAQQLIYFDAVRIVAPQRQPLGESFLLSNSAD